jgi:hypothetical protein
MYDFVENGIFLFVDCRDGVTEIQNSSGPVWVPGPKLVKFYCFFSTVSSFFWIPSVKELERMMYHSICRPLKKDEKRSSYPRSKFEKDVSDRHLETGPDRHTSHKVSAALSVVRK